MRAGFCTLRELRELIDGLADDVEVCVLAPTTGDDWRLVGADVSAHLSPPPTQVWISLDEGVGDDAVAD